MKTLKIGEWMENRRLDGKEKPVRGNTESVIGYGIEPKLIILII